MMVVYVLLGLFLVPLALLGNSIILMRSENKRLLREVGFYQTTYLRRQGGIAKSDEFLNYDLRSLDGGLTWYAVQREGGVVKVIGEVNEVYPGLLDHLIGMDALVVHVQKYGPIGANGVSTDDLRVLSGAGFTVENK